MATQKHLETAQLYAALMEEIKIRIAAIDAGTGGQLQMLPPLIVREHCYLQLRMIYELIALGCLVAHGDIEPAQRRLSKEWAADRIMEGLEKLNPNFFPQPCLQGRDERGNHTLTAINPSPLPKAELIRLYGKAGDILHRGSIKKLLSQKMPIVIHYPDITALAQQVLDLLRVHIVATLDEPFFVCVLWNSNDNNRVQVATIASGVPLSP